MIRLIVKELRQLSPIGLLWLALLAVGWAMQLLAGRVDEESFGSWYEEVLGTGTDPGVAVIASIVCLVTAWSLFPREHDDSTIDFLRALPISRARLFAAKVLAAMLLLGALFALGYALDAALLAANPETFGGRFYAQAWATLAWRDMAFAFVMLCHGVLLSWFRVTGLVVFALYIVSVMLLESQTGSAGLYSVLGMLSNEYDGSRLVVDRVSIAVHVALGGLSLLVAYRLWSATPSAAGGGRADPRGGARVRAALVVLGLVGAGGVLVTRLGPGAIESASGEAVELEVASTDYYRFAFDPADRRTVDSLLARADDDFRALGELLGVEASRLPRVRVDLAASSEHAAGLATWKTIKMDLATFETDRSQARVLSHESAHVMQAVLSERALARHFAAARFFVEGMAQYTSFAIVPEPERRASNRAIAAVAWARQEIRFENLIDAGFAATFDPDLYYSLGDLWSGAFRATCGPDSFGDFLRAAGREDVPRRLPPMLFWTDTLREIDCGLEDVNERFRVEMRALADGIDGDDFPRFESPLIERLPDGRVRISVDVVAAEGESAPPPRLPERFVVRVGAGASVVAAVDPVFRGRVEGGGERGAGEGGATRAVFDIPARAVPRARFEYQLGYAPFADSRVYYAKRRTGSAPP